MNLDTVKFDAFYLVKLIFGKYFRYFDANRVAEFTAIALAIGHNLHSGAQES